MEPFHYSHHYSSAAVVLGYLERLEPFSQSFIELSGGTWDWPDRLFHTVAGTWNLVTKGKLPQIMELTPEFYYLPDFLSNPNKYYLGKTDNGVDVSVVKLPPWAHNNPKEFIARNLEALESPHVSKHLNEWIDLIFGYKQRGQAAVDAVNTFDPVSYEGGVDIDAITDEMERKARIAKIREFGQTPRQLWDKQPHPCRSPAASEIPPPPPWSVAGAKVVPTIISKVGSLPVACIRVPGNTDKVYSTCTGRIILSTSQPQLQVAFGYADQSIRLWNGEKHISTCYPCPGFFTKAVAAVEDGSMLITGSDDCLVRVFRIGGNETGDVNAIPTSTETETTDTSSSTTTTVAAAKEITSGASSGVYVLSSSSFTGDSTSTTGNSLSGRGPFVLAMKLSGHNVPVSCVDVSRDYSIIVSGGSDGRCIIWDLNEGTCVNYLDVSPRIATKSAKDKLPSSSSTGEEGEEDEDLYDPIVCIDIHGVTGEIVACTSKHITVWSVNGQLEASASVDSRQPRAGDILCCAFSNEWIPGRGRVLLTGHQDGTVTVWDMEPVIYALEPIELPCKNVLSAGEGTAGITALYIPYHDRTKFYAGNAFGIVTQWSETKKR